MFYLLTSRLWVSRSGLANQLATIFDQFIKFLRQLHQINPLKKMIIILDNGPIQKSKKVKKFIQKKEWVELFFAGTDHSF
ncbi:hypothetical protein E3983_05350 [Legionella israelensis]|uniref:Transposase n=1 Tax=Legionella israelensis TaxID=454 RepID=A0AAX1EJS9_9GAMM|nr:hypothetical protein E3983_05275 [Legionella israelensis]QBR85322.1 hypothetical protein E3983_05350 [Legionella israelensis]